jgi:hypothetical protein
MKKQLLLILLCFTVINTTQAQIKQIVSADGVVLDNPYLHVNQNSTSYTLANNATIGTRIIAALEEVVIKSSKGNRTLIRGQVAVFLENESYQISSGKYFEIAFKKDHPPLTVPEQWVEPQKNTIVYEDAQFRIFEERLEAGDIRDLHSHAQRLVVRLNLVQLTDPRLNKEVKEGTGIQVPNTVKFAEPVVHAVKNLSKIPLFNIVIEFKIPH